MNNENQNELTPLTNIQPVPEVNELPDWVKGLEQELEVNALDILNKQHTSTTLVPEELKKDSVEGIRKLAEVSKEYFTENELIFMYVVGVRNMMSLTEELQRTKQMLQFFAGMATPMGDATSETTEE